MSAVDVDIGNVVFKNCRKINLGEGTLGENTVDVSKAIRGRGRVGVVGCGGPKDDLLSDSSGMAITLF